ncbi:hypothetical protein SLOPH_1750 [Spraguea lophii 42_110]|uniref:Uncharacterized protein n=1 Tax=Spraguea lophii (strain 42_110) TaxID=1358809 RepID=S7WAM3_SPRLO|nr:hypothetical protein SLOPH_1750 [Spraguea lophii 42_110]
MLIPLNLSNKLGSIFQIHKEKFILKKELILIQTYGIKKKDSYTCTDIKELKELLWELSTHNIYKRIVIDSISTLNIENNIILLFRLLKIKGVDIVLVCFEHEKLWYVDKILG